MTIPTAVMKRVLDVPYVAYSYSYPHKSAYGPLTPAVSLDELWRTEKRDSLFVYVHLPFCEMRCGFCNLFARAGGDEPTIDAYLDALDRQAKRLAEATSPGRSISRAAIGGGTPTFLSAKRLDRLFDILADRFDLEPRSTPTSVETSPKTATDDRLAVLKGRQVQRISVGVQSFLDEEAHAIGRPQQSAEVHAALRRIRSLDFPVLNIDLIYGQPLQTLESWLDSVRTAVDYDPEEIFLYPLYVRPETGLARREAIRRFESSAAQRLYRAGRDVLLASGYEQLSMRCFRRAGAVGDGGPAYCCQSDGMIGLGAGARSYTSRLHYSSRFAVTGAGVQAITDRWTRQTESDFGFADWGIRLCEDERRRRYVIQSLLHHDGLDRDRFLREFGLPPEEGVSELRPLLESDLIRNEDGVLRLTHEGLAWSDAVGPALYSERSRRKLAEFTAT